MRAVSLFLVFTALVSAFRVVHEDRSFHLAHRPTSRIRANPNAILPVRIGLIQRNLEHGYRHLMDVSHPESPNYGQHWSDEQIDAEFAPSAKSVDTVRQWLADNNIDATQTGNKGWLVFDAPVGVAEQLFGTHYFEYQTGEDDSVTIGCDRYSLPQHITPHIDYITPGVNASPRMYKKTLKRELSSNRDIFKLFNRPPIEVVENTTDPLANCGSRITPTCLRALYNISEPPTEGFLAPGLLGIFEGGGEQYAQEDLDKYFASYAPYVPNGTHPQLSSINGALGPTSPKNAAGEPDIDFEIAYAIVGNSSIILYAAQPPANQSFTNFIDPFLDAVDGSYCDAHDRAAGFQCGGTPLTSVVSVSYDSAELFELSYKVQQRACNEFMKMGLAGYTLVFSSGDYGVASNPLLGENLCGNNGCVPQNLNNTGEGTFNGTIFSPGFPSNCPYVLSVGATMLSPGQSVYEAESAMTVPNVGIAACDSHVSFSSGGGFSNYFARPSYQDSLVNTYLQSHIPQYKSYVASANDVTSPNTTIGKNGGIYNRAGRGYPDVSANGAYYDYYNRDNLSSNDGTSLSTPLWASLIAIINQNRISQNKSSVGFVNPVLYQHPEVFHDVVNGSNAGCGTDGFPAAAGWDPITGLGTPNFPALLDLFLGLP